MNRRTALLTAGVALAGASTRPLRAVDPAPPPSALTPKQVADGWVKLFDGSTAFGWPAGTKVEGGALVLAAPADKGLAVPLPAAPGGQYEVVLNLPAGETAPAITVATAKGDARRVSAAAMAAGAYRYELPTDAVSAVLPVPAGTKLAVTAFQFKPPAGKPLFDGKTLAGWEVYKGDPKRERSKFTVTPAGEIHVSDGPGDLRTASLHGDFLLQFECKTASANLNSGVFFRCVPGLYQAGYEAQVHNGHQPGDRTKPLDGGTGAIYRRVPARSVVSNDKEWFTMTVLAVGPSIRTWVSGEPVVVWTDDRPRDDNPRKGLRTAPGHLSIQGHDPTTDILFRNLRVTDIQ